MCKIAPSPSLQWKANDLLIYLLYRSEAGRLFPIVRYFGHSLDCLLSTAVVKRILVSEFSSARITWEYHWGPLSYNFSMIWAAPLYVISPRKILINITTLCNTSGRRVLFGNLLFLWLHLLLVRFALLSGWLRVGFGLDFSKKMTSSACEYGNALFWASSN